MFSLRNKKNIFDFLAIPPLIWSSETVTVFSGSTLCRLPFCLLLILDRLLYCKIKLFHFWDNYNCIVKSTIPFLGQLQIFRCPDLTLLHSERRKLHTILAFLSAVGLRIVLYSQLCHCFLSFLDRGPTVNSDLL